MVLDNKILGIKIYSNLLFSLNNEKKIAFAPQKDRIYMKIIYGPSLDITFDKNYNCYVNKKLVVKGGVNIEKISEKCLVLIKEYREEKKEESRENEEDKNKKSIYVNKYKERKIEPKITEKFDSKRKRKNTNNRSRKKPFIE